MYMYALLPDPFRRYQDVIGVMVPFGSNVLPNLPIGVASYAMQASAVCLKECGANSVDCAIHSGSKMDRAAPLMGGNGGGGGAPGGAAGGNGGGDGLRSCKKVATPRMIATNEVVRPPSTLIALFILNDWRGEAAGVLLVATAGEAVADGGCPDDGAGA